MILKVNRQQRNYNYLELIRMYNQAIEEYGADNNISKDNFSKINDSLTKSLIGMETVEIIKNALVSDEDLDNNNSLELFYTSDNEYGFMHKNKILPVASKEEAEIVYSMLQNGDFDLFLSENQKKIISDNLNRYFDNAGLHPINLYDYIDVKGGSHNADNLSEIKDYFIQLKKAVQFKNFAKIAYDYNDMVEDYIIQPIGFVYSQLDLRLRVKAFLKEGTLRTFYISNIKKIEIIEKEYPFEPLEEKADNIKELIFSFENIRGRAERVAARFSDYKKKIRYDKKSNTITYNVFYHDTPTENNRIIFRLCSLGLCSTIQTEEKEQVQQNARRALENYKKGAE